MKFFWIEIENYRQYKGNIKMDFSVSNSKNFTVIQGVNGAGKTNLINAITWCLYGFESHLMKSKEQLGKVNENVVLALQEGEKTSAKVKITLGDNDPEFMIERECVVEKIDGKIWLRERIPRAWRVINKDWVAIKSPETMVRSLLPEKIHEFFFFDGERLDNFFRRGSAENVKEAILDVSQIQLLETTIIHTKRVRNQIVDEARSKTPDIEKIQKEINSVESGKEYNENKLSEINTELNIISLEINEKKDFLRSSSQDKIKSLQEKRDLIERQIKQNKKTLESYKQDCNQNLLLMGGPIISFNEIEKTMKIINDKYESGELPPKIRDVFLRELLERGDCICGSDLVNDDEAKNRILELLKKTGFSKIAKQVTEGKFILENIIRNIPSQINRQNEIRQRISDLHDLIKENKEELNMISEEIQGYDIEEVRRIESRLSELETRKAKKHQDQGVIQDQINRAERLLKELDKKLEKELKNNKDYTDLVTKRDICHKVIDVVSEIKEELINEVREKIETNTNDYFKNLIWKKEAFSQVTIDMDYHLSVKNRHGSEVLGSLSAGERQVLALAFLSALRGISGFSAPVFIDTPLGRISGEPRCNIADLLPKYLEEIQVTLLVTDEEYTNAVRSRLLPYIGHEYRLDYSEKESSTKVVNYSE